MIDDQGASNLALGLIREYDGLEFPKIERDRKFYFLLDDMVYNRPEDALLVIGKLSKFKLSPQAVEGIGGGAIRDMLMLYGDMYDDVFDKMISENHLFGIVMSIARDGMGYQDLG